MIALPFTIKRVPFWALHAPLLFVVFFNIVLIIDDFQKTMSDTDDNVLKYSRVNVDNRLSSNMTSF
jgi:hypothetical protein